MVWQEQDKFDPDNLLITFEQTEGDAEEFRGSWQIKPVNAEECIVTFKAEFSLGIPSLADILEPVAEEAIRENILEMLENMLIKKVA